MLLTPTLSGFNIFNDASLLIQNWQVSRPYPEMLLKKINDNFRNFSRKFVITISVENNILTINLIYLIKIALRSCSTTCLKFGFVRARNLRSLTRPATTVRFTKLRRVEEHCRQRVTRRTSSFGWPSPQKCHKITGSEEESLCSVS